MSCIVLRGRWCNVVVFNVHSPSEEKSDDSKAVFIGIRAEFDHFLKYHTKIILGDFNTKWGERIFSNRQLEMRVYIRIVMKIVLE